MTDPAPSRRRETAPSGTDGQAQGRGPAGGGRDRDSGRAGRDDSFGRDRDRNRAQPRRSEAGRADGEPRRDDRGGSRTRHSVPASSAKAVSFEDSFDSELEREFGELGPDPRVRRGGRRGARGSR